MTVSICFDMIVDVVWRMDSVNPAWIFFFVIVEFNFRSRWKKCLFWLELASRFEKGQFFSPQNPNFIKNSVRFSYFFLFRSFQNSLNVMKWWILTKKSYDEMMKILALIIPFEEISPHQILSSNIETFFFRI